MELIRENPELADTTNRQFNKRFYINSYYMMVSCGLFIAYGVSGARRRVRAEVGIEVRIIQFFLRRLIKGDYHHVISNRG